MTDREFKLIVFRFIAPSIYNNRECKRQTAINPYTLLLHTNKYKQKFNLI